MVAVLTEDQWTRVREIAHTIFREPFTRRTWSELIFFSLGVPVACLGLAFVALTMAADWSSPSRLSVSPSSPFPSSVRG